MAIDQTVRIQLGSRWEADPARVPSPWAILSKDRRSISLRAPVEAVGLARLPLDAPQQAYMQLQLYAVDFNAPRPYLFAPPERVKELIDSGVLTPAPKPPERSPATPAGVVEYLIGDMPYYIDFDHRLLCSGTAQPTRASNPFIDCQMFSEDYSYAAMFTAPSASADRLDHARDVAEHLIREIVLPRKTATE